MKLKKLFIILLSLVLVSTFMVGCSKGITNNPNEDTEVKAEDKSEADKEEKVEPKEPVELLISAAASLTDVLGELAEVYKTVEPETTLTFTFGGSGALQTQIEEGAPVDVFMSAAQKQMNALEEGGHILDGTIKTLLVNKVVLITPKDGKIDIKSFEDLAKDEIKKIAIGDPGNVPVGQYSEEIFNNLNIADKINSKLVLANDVRTVLTWVESGEVDCGIVYATDAFTSDSINIITEAPEGSHKEVSYPVAVIKDSQNSGRSQAFLDFLSTDEAIKLFEKYGFSMK
ncbi:molybdate ABC transporter substrate-binding protein [Tissierella carlieri]|uniref:Molybdate ABC transporter substrate-binding protein n=1 Tax=Tissierella carlieri TaxID=689904 RepID=A0ABT1SGN1_9FIRM|nr:molybdate ABC transporter substrate-binding protein [Tissierella carlieri]MBU5313012.1 molybdate ABC transporter substrate-binding protein [Tissierella carlieri]MCQ4925647.1 molybdate ABC transporter substrate-binding protein [Tissierella carlieri]